jgi:hypothetical protein
LKKRFGFDAILAHYHLLAEDDVLRIYLRDDYVRRGPLADRRVTSVSSPVSASD